VAHVIVAALRGAVSRIQSNDPDARRGDGEGIHRLRTSTRRLRSELRAFCNLVDPQWREPLQAELKWLAGVLGQVRDLDVLLARLRGAAVKAGESDLRDLDPLLDELEARHARALSTMQEALQSDRYHKLLVALERAIAHPAIAEEAWESCRTAAPPLVAAAWRRLKKPARGLKPSGLDADFHEVRKRAKRARYTAELIAPALGRRAAKGARRFIRLVTQVQDTLGEHQDAIVAQREIQSGLAAHPREEPFTQAARVLLESQRDAAKAARTAFFEVWDQLDRKKNRRWFQARSKARCKSQS
jgi:CHAD domain-containing protein